MQGGTMDRLIIDITKFTKKKIYTLVLTNIARFNVTQNASEHSKTIFFFSIFLLLLFFINYYCMYHFEGRLYYA